MSSRHGTSQGRLVIVLTTVVAISIVTAVWVERSSPDRTDVEPQKASQQVNLPPIPDFPLESLEPAVEEQFQQALDRVNESPLDEQANGQLGMLFHAYEFYTLAEQCYRRAVGGGGTNVQWRYYLGLVLLERGRWVDAANEFSKFLTRRPGDLSALLRRADAYRLADSLQVALDEYRLVISQSTEIAQAYCGAGQVLYRLGEFELAVEHLRTAVQIAPEYGTAHYVLGQALRNQGHTGEARRELGLAQEYRNQEPPLDDPLARAVDRARIGAIEALHSGIDFLKAGEVDTAIELFETAIRIEPTLAEAHAQLGAALLEQNELEAAADSLQRALSLEPNYVEAIYHLGLIAHRLQDYAGAVGYFQRTVQLRAEHFDAHLGLGTDLPRVQQFELAIEHLRRANELRPHDSRPYKRLGALLSQLAHYEEAIAVLRVGLQNLPEDATLADRLAWMLATCPQDDLREADEALRLAMEVCRRTKNQVPQALDTQAAALANLGRFGEAIVVAEQARQVALAGNNQQLADQIRQRLELYQAAEPYRQPIIDTLPHDIGSLEDLGNVGNDVRLSSPGGRLMGLGPVYGPADLELPGGS